MLHTVAHFDPDYRKHAMKHTLHWHWNLENLIRAGSNLDPSAEDGCLFISFHTYLPTHHISHACDINDSPVWQPLEHLQQGLGLLLQQLLVFLQALLRPSGGPTLDHLSQPYYVLFFFMLFQVILSVWILWKLKLTNWVKSTSKLRPTILQVLHCIGSSHTITTLLKGSTGSRWQMVVKLKK